ncbi:class I adenylate-forming enzyme family protein [Pontimicrobium sp. MEBiC01747]
MITQMQQLLEQSAGKYQDKTAISFSKKDYSFTAIEHESNNLACYFQTLGIQRGDRIVILLGNTIETIISFWAILKVGAIVIPVGTEMKTDKIDYILNDSRASILITNETIALENKAIFKAHRLKKVLISNLTKAQPEPWMEAFENALVTNSNTLIPSGVISIDLAAIIYTSGSTGEPKGVMHTHDSMLAATHSLNTYLSYNYKDRVLCALPLSFDYGLYQMIMSISTGATLVLEKEFTWPIFLLKKIATKKITILPGVPTMIMLLHEQNKVKNFDLSSVRAVTNTGAALTRTNIEMIKTLFTNAKIFSMYGLTECKRCTYLPPEEIDSKIDCVGIAIPNTELWLVDDDNNKITTPHQIGQLVIRGATVMKGYWNKPSKTAEKLKTGIYPGEQVLYTGDYCSLDEDGYLYFKGRMDHMINSRGIKVSPKEVEDFIGTLPEINAVVITGIPHKDYGEALFAFVVLKEAQNISEMSIILECKKALEAYKVPEHISIIPAMPKTPNGKFNVIALKAMALEFLNSNIKTQI